MLPEIIEYEKQLAANKTAEPIKILDLSTLEKMILKMLDEGYDLIPSSAIRADAITKGFTHYQSVRKLVDIRVSSGKGRWSISRSLAEGELIERYSKNMYKRRASKPPKPK